MLNTGLFQGTPSKFTLTVNHQRHGQTQIFIVIRNRDAVEEVLSKVLLVQVLEALAMGFGVFPFRIVS